MKALRILSLLGLIVTLLTYSSCKDDKPTPEPITDVQLGKLVGTWNVDAVTLNDVDKKAEYPAFKLVISGTKGETKFDSTTSGRPSLSPWKSSGKWEFGTAPETQIIRDKGTADELPMTYAVTETTLSISFTFDGAGYTSRTGVVKGQWVFTFKR